MIDQVITGVSRQWPLARILGEMSGLAVFIDRLRQGAITVVGNVEKGGSN